MENIKIYVQITNCSNPNFWYNNKIGTIYEVQQKKERQWYEKSQKYYVIVHESLTELRINDNDCIEITRKLKILKLKDKLNEIS